MLILHERSGPRSVSDLFLFEEYFRLHLLIISIYTLGPCAMYMWMRLVVVVVVNKKMSAHEQLRCIYTPYECKLFVCGLWSGNIV